MSIMSLSRYRPPFRHVRTARYRSKKSSSHRHFPDQVLLSIIIFAAMWPLFYRHGVLTTSPCEYYLCDWSHTHNARPPTTNYITDNTTIRGILNREAAITRDHPKLGQLRSCRTHSNMYHVDPFGYCRPKSTNVTAILIHNPFHFERIVCGQTIPGSKSIVLTGNENASDRWKCLEQPSNLYPIIPTVDNAMQFPPVQLSKVKGSSKGYKPIDQPCDVPCHKGKIGGLVRTIYVQGPGYSWPFIASMEGEGYYKQLKINPQGYKNNQFHSTTSFRSEVPRAYYSPTEYDIQSPPVDYDKVIKGASFLARNCGSKSGREKIVKGLISFADKLKQKDVFRVDSLSSCLKNASPPPGVNMKNKVDVQRRYLFHLSFENSITEDYITEKLWGALASGSLPVYLGSPNVETHAPPHSIINAADFDAPESLGEYLVKVASNKTLYESYHAWRSKPLPEYFMKRYNHTNTHSECRLCRWAHARRYGISFDHEAQALSDTKIPRQALVGLKRNKGMLTSPLVENWRLGDGAMKSRLAKYDATHNSTSRIINESSRSIVLSGAGGDLLQRDAWEHDGVIDLHVKAIGYIEPNTNSVLILQVTVLSGNVTMRATNDYAYIQSKTSRFTFFATSGVSYDYLSMSNAVALIIPSEVLPVRIRILTEDVDTFHDGGDQVKSYFATTMMADFQNPLEGFYMESGVLSSEEINSDVKKKDEQRVFNVSQEEDKQRAINHRRVENRISNRAEDEVRALNLRREMVKQRAIDRRQKRAETKQRALLSNRRQKRDD